MSEATERKVVQMPGREEKVFNVEWTVNIGKDRQARILTDFPQNGDEESFNKALDMMDRAMSRQKARHEIAEMSAEIETIEDQSAIWQHDHDEAEADYKKKIAAIDVKIGEVKRLSAEFDQSDAQERARSGRSTDGKKPHQVKQQQAAHIRSIAHYVADKEKMAAERDQALNVLKVNLKGAEKRVQRIKAKIEKKRQDYPGC